MPVKSKSTQLSENKLARNEPSGLYAVVDIGSNSVRLVVYDRLGRAPLPRFNEKSLCRLADGLAETSELSEESCRRAPVPCRRRRNEGRPRRFDRDGGGASGSQRGSTVGSNRERGGFQGASLERRGGGALCVARRPCWLPPTNGRGWRHGWWESRNRRYLQPRSQRIFGQHAAGRAACAGTVGE